MASLARAAAFLAAGALLFAVPAIAAEPESGTVSTATPKVEWTGDSNAYGIYPFISINGEPDCSPPFCDSFALTVADQGDLVISADNMADAGPGCDCVTMFVTKPDGSEVSAEADAAAATVKIKNAAPGAYEVRFWVNQPVGMDGAYAASATLGGGGAAPPAGGPPAGGGDPAPPTGEPPSGEPAPSPTMKLKTTKLSARKAKKRPKLALSSDGEVNSVRVTLLKGSKALGTGTIGKLDGTASVALKVKKKLKKGAYTVAAAGKDSLGRDVTMRAKLKVVR